jgi:hypothetical protein
VGEQTRFTTWQALYVLALPICWVVCALSVLNLIRTFDAAASSTAVRSAGSDDGRAGCVVKYVRSDFGAGGATIHGVLTTVCVPVGNKATKPPVV